MGSTAVRFEGLIVVSMDESSKQVQFVLISYIAAHASILLNQRSSVIL
jgi:hypothetical protein